MRQRNLRLCLFGVVAIAGAAVVLLVFAGQTPAQENLGTAPIQGQSLTFHLEGAFIAKVSCIPFDEGIRLKAIKPLAEMPEVKVGQAVKIKIPDQYLPGEFVLRIDFRTKETDPPYPMERNIYINQQDIEVFVNPITGATRFDPGETENTAYHAFIKEDNLRRPQIDLLRQILFDYDRPQSNFYCQAVEEFEQRRQEYNAWLSEQAKTYQKLYVSRLFQFQYVPAMVWSGDEKERRSQLIKNYFEGIDFNDPLLIRSRQLSMFIDGYVRLYALQAENEAERKKLLTQAGSVACERASQGHPKVYGWMVDYFYSGYETYNIEEGIKMLKKHIDNPHCLTSKREEIIKRLEGVAKLTPMALAPDFNAIDSQGNIFEFHKYKGKAAYKLLLFWSAGCASCQHLVNELRQWYNEPANKEKLDIIAVGLDETETDVQKWESAIATLPGWKHLHTKGGVNSQVARDYAILSTPAMFLIGSKSNVIVSVPGNLEQLIKDLHEQKKE